MSTHVRTGLRSLLKPHPNDVVILSALRTPITRSYKGGLKDCYDHQLLYHILRATLQKFPDLDPSRIEDICIGNVLSELGGSKAGRMAALAAGIPETAGFSTMNRACASGLSAITSIAHSIMSGTISVGIGGGMESMTRNYDSRAIPTQLWDKLRHADAELASGSDEQAKHARDCVMSMGLTAENVAERYGVSRQAQDAFAARSQARALKAQKEGVFDAEIVPVPCTWTDPKTPDAAPQETVVQKDDGIRATTEEKLASMKPAFKPDGTATAGNSSQISDGAGAVLMMARSTAEAMGLQNHVIGKWCGTQTVGCRPDEMGIGPVPAIRRLLEFTDVKKKEVDVWEINEAFAAQAVHCVKELGLEEGEDGQHDPEASKKINPNGGAIALGHPLGATGARMLTGLLNELGRREQKVGVMSMCVGTGMGSAALIIRE